jgi:diguanylate cyclase (GGDEF)-like protein
MHRVKTLPVLVLAAGVAAIALIAVLQARSDASRRAQIQLGKVGSQLNERANLPLEVMFGAPPPHVRVEMQERGHRIQSIMSRLQADAPIPQLQAVDVALSRTFATDRGNLALISLMATKAGRVQMANSLMSNGHELALTLQQSQRNSEAMVQALDAASAEYARRASRARFQATIGTASAIALLLLAFAFAYRRSTQAHSEAEELAAENASMAEVNRKEAFTDALTELGNRRALIAALDQALARAEQAPVALVLFDLDGFKQYNDAFGHQAGDALLRRLGERLLARFDGAAGTYRMGGDEFCLLAPLDGDGADGIAAAGAEALSETGEGFSIGCSYGIAIAPAEVASAEQALRLADKRMYDRKAARRGASTTRQATDVLLQVLAEQSAGLAEHVSEVGDLAASIAERLGMTEFEVRQVHLAAQLHDVGKSAIPASILDKPARLDEDEWECIRRHTEIGERIVQAAPSLSHAAHLIRSSHERVDGHGYPDGLAGGSIPLGARIIAVCDAFDAMVAKRPYRNAVGVAAALAELRRCAGTQFDAQVVETFCELVESNAEPLAA